MARTGEKKFLAEEKRSACWSGVLWTKRQMSGLLRAYPLVLQTSLLACSEQARDCPCATTEVLHAAILLSSRIPRFWGHIPARDYFPDQI
jgi:hypothetical protein